MYTSYHGLDNQLDSNRNLRILTLRRTQYKFYANCDPQFSTPCAQSCTISPPCPFSPNFCHGALTNLMVDPHMPFTGRETPHRGCRSPIMADLPDLLPGPRRFLSQLTVNSRAHNLRAHTHESNGGLRPQKVAHTRTRSPGAKMG